MKKEKWFTMRMSDRMLNKLEDLCRENERSKTSQIEELIKKEWDKNHKK